MAFVTFDETLHYLYETLPMFQRLGAPALKPDLSNTLSLCAELGNPQNRFPTVHVAGTNGKGSTSHMLAAILQTAGYKTGLYTSPHLKSFTERIRVNGMEVDKEYIVDFVNRMRAFTETIRPSFFELTVAMAFDYFARTKVDIAVIETGLGGRLDSTNIIHPVLSIITNIGMDHKALLGDTLQKIAGEKAGIIKPNTPVVISERQEEVQDVFQKKAFELQAPLTFASDGFTARFRDPGHRTLEIDRTGKPWITVTPMSLGGGYQTRNVPGVVAGVEILRKHNWRLSEQDIATGLIEATRLTGLLGRWQIIGHNPLIVCDTGHNAEAVTEVVKQLRAMKYESLLIVWGMVKDKDVGAVLNLLPATATYFFCAADLPRAMPAGELAAMGRAAGLSGEPFPTVTDAFTAAKRTAKEDDLVFVGGSTFVVAEIPEL